MARASFNGQILAESDQTVEVDGNPYFPPESINSDFFRESTTTTVCGWKGTANYYDVVVDGQSIKDGAWYYPDTKPEADNIRGKIAFWKNKGISIEA